MTCFRGILSVVPKYFLRALNAYAPPLLWAGVIFIFSAQSVLPGFDVDLTDFLFKKLAHMFVYGVLYALLFRAVNLERGSTKKNWVVPFLLCLTYALLDEVHQSFTPNRTPSLRDVGYDFLGASVAFLKIYRYI